MFLRFSSKGYPKQKVEGLSKYHCIKNLISSFSDWEIYCVADNCDEDALNLLRGILRADRIRETRLGNPGSFWACYAWAMEISSDDDLIYFCEDDYIHTDLSSRRIVQGLSRFDYVTLYDHPDKYRTFSGPLNPYVKHRKYSECTETVQIEGALWRTTNSTTMTFALTGSVLFEDARIWRLSETSRRDMDFAVFCALTRQPLLKRSSSLREIPLRLKVFFQCPKRYLGVCIPGEAFHTEVVYLTENDQKRMESLLIDGSSLTLGIQIPSAQ